MRRDTDKILLVVMSPDTIPFLYTPACHTKPVLMTLLYYHGFRNESWLKCVLRSKCRSVSLLVQMNEMCDHGNEDCVAMTNPSRSQPLESCGQSGEQPWKILPVWNSDILERLWFPESSSNGRNPKRQWVRRCSELVFRLGKSLSQLLYIHR